MVYRQFVQVRANTRKNEIFSIFHGFETKNSLFSLCVCVCDDADGEPKLLYPGRIGGTKQCEWGGARQTY